jgi:Leucine-rich repeat (LRR) protein
VKLTYLTLNENQLSGSIPPELGKLTNIVELNLESNRLSGSIPPELGKLANLKELLLGSNQLSGRIPPSLGNLEQLGNLVLSNNQLSGSIPPELGNLPNLQGLHLASNRLSGSIPSSLGDLEQLGDLDLSANRLSGNIPPQLAKLERLGELKLSYNTLHATDIGLLEFLNSKQPEWQNTQTIAPKELSATTQSNSSILVTWVPIPYISNTSRYEVFLSTVRGGPYTIAGAIHAHFPPSFTVTGLKPATSYYIVMRTVTDPNGNNRNNTITSEYSREISATTR